ncbi:ATPase domain-containing protein [Ktedonobacter racemifer]|uniref:Non-specific serine/threonine protein kinase n=1 Tax=Ktedonobacter racemifer DSM 44963 TaxID=485913 RepID=D6TZV0_KTERA|nr:ATPase domain-containing protein [Ktedonobacter racemifer]EFH82090.1 Non-specific serine/threonine protein kinase [Ktedonobacter racemifer DSM 44963]
MSTPSSDADQTPTWSSSSNMTEATGVPQLDIVLGGGLPKGSLAIILGSPGSGKTTLASQIAFSVARHGQKALLLTALSEPTTKLLSHLQSYSFFAPELVGNEVQIFSIQQFLTQGKLPAAQDIVAAVRQTRANLVVLDGFQAIRALEPDFVTSRQLLYDLGARLSLLGTTTIITTEADPRDPTLFPEMTTGDLLIGLYFTLNGTRAFRSLEILKVRGRAPMLGRHSMVLGKDGVQVYPRLEDRSHMIDHSSTRVAASKEDRATFGLLELDTLLGGGLTRRTSTLLAGSLGTGKTLLALQFALSAIPKGEKTLFLSFRETRDQLLLKAESFHLGEQLRTALAPGGGLILQRWEPVEIDPDEVATTMLNTLNENGIRRVVIDSIAELERAVVESSGRDRVSNYLAALLAMLRSRDITLLALKEAPKAISTDVDFSADTLSILAENVILVQHLAVNNSLHRVISVLKMRFSAHDHNVREFIITSPEGISVLTPQESDLDTLAGLTREVSRNSGYLSPTYQEPPSDRGSV